jgi:uncharacterized protein (TIGR03083 family)
MTTTTASAQPRTPALDRPTAMRLAATEYDRNVALLRELSPQDWSRPTECAGWDVNAMAAHMLGMAEMAASIPEMIRQQKAARRRGGVFIDALTAVQVEGRSSLSPRELVDRFASVAPKAVRARRRTPGLVRRRTMPEPQPVGDGSTEPWTFGYLLDVILTRDPWMHRVDISRATARPLDLTADHDGVLVADVATEWAARHGQPYALHLTGPAGGRWTSGAGGPDLELDAVEFCRLVSGRGSDQGVLDTRVPF